MRSGPTTLQERVHSSPPPAGWSLNKLHRVFRVRKGYKNTGMQEDNLLSLSYGRIIRKSIDAAEGLLPESFETYQIVEPGNIVMRLTDLQNDKRSLRQGLVKERGIITSAYDALELEKGHDPRFWAYALLALDLAKYYYSMGGGVRQSIKFSDFPNDWISTPDSDTQKAIADFLDREIARIDQLIEKKQRLVGLLGEQKAAVVSKAVTVGLPERFDLVRTSSRFLPHVPAGWVVTRLKHLGRIRGGLTLGRAVPEGTPTQATPYLRVANVQAGWIDLSDVAEVEATRSEVTRYSLRAGDILMNEGGDNDKLGRGAVWHAPFEPCLNQNHVFAVTPFAAKQAEWISLATNANYARDFFYFYSNQSTNLASISKTNLSEFPVAIPPEEQMEKILRLTKQKVGDLEKLTTLTKRSIERLREFRSALITAAVTGQIDVAAATVHGADENSLDQNAAARGMPNATPSQVRRLVAAEIIHDHRNVAYLGRIKVHKIMFLAEAHANINEISGRYRRHRAGPFDSEMIDDVEAGLRQDRFYDAVEDPNSQHGRIAFTPLDNAGGHKPTLEAMLGDRVAELRRIIGLVQDFSTENTEAIATLYAVWNDALIDGEQPDDERIIRGFREEWHEAKQRFTEENLRIWLDWMRRNDLVPRGSGPHTISAHQPSLF